MDNYYRYLVSIVEGNPESMLMGFLFDCEYEPINNPMDENRAQDGIYLRYEYARDTGYDVPRELGKCRFLEFLIGLSRRISDYTYDFYDNNHEKERIISYFWDMIQRVKLDKYEDLSYIKSVTNGIKSGTISLFSRHFDESGVDIWRQLTEFY